MKIFKNSILIMLLVTIHRITSDKAFCSFRILADNLSGMAKRSHLSSLINNSHKEGSYVPRTEKQRPLRRPYTTSYNSALNKKIQLKEVDFQYCNRFTEQYYFKEDLLNKLEERRPLRIKYGVDVTSPFLHLGHAVNLWVMRHFQECGHKVIFLIGDFTTKIGDPTGRSETRKIIPYDQIQKYSQEFIHQVGSVLHTDPSVFEIQRNSEWFGKMSLSKFLELASLTTHSTLIKRDMFQKRMQNEKEIHINEMLYPVLQGYDSVMLESDLTVVGSDQFFNENIGRFLQEKLQQKPQVILTTKITPGTDGKEKQSKSLGNFIALDDSPRDKFGKILSIPDSLIFPYLEVYTTLDILTIKHMAKQVSSRTLNPMEAKKTLGHEIVARYHGKKVADEELDWFINVFSKRNEPSDILIVKINGDKTLLDIMKLCLPLSSKTSLRKLISQGAVSLLNVKLTEQDKKYNFVNGNIIKIGKRGCFSLKIK